MALTYHFKSLDDLATFLENRGNTIRAQAETEDNVRKKMQLIKEFTIWQTIADMIRYSEVGQERGSKCR